ncbi:MAG: hydantoinase/carbamoylase family amidase, partial [Thaumarchaeota archaeon]|nr:hydantoinase/carbamoylase family amidase [Nitrososphaerota archaeon]
MRISNDRLLDDLKALGEIGASEGQGRTRVVFSAEDFEARNFLIGRMKEAGLSVRIDDVGNIIGRRGDQARKLPVVALGSHIDTVPNAGMLDGCYGVVGALEVIRTLEDNDVLTSLPLEVIAFSDEEGVRFPLTVGSKVLAGLTTVQDALQLKDSAGVSYLQALESWGRPSSSLVPARRESGEFKAWVELHVEQGSALDSSGVKIGIVKAIVGITQLLVTIRGEAGHAGASPMVGRHDALRGSAQIVLDVDRIARETGARTVGTVGHLDVRPGAMNVIPGEVELGVDFRDASANLI